jgi:dolichyl-phosphate beta-glucosyltransferase
MTHSLPFDSAKRLSIVLPAFNETHRLPATLESLRSYLHEHVPNHEVIVVDDGSSDGTATLVREFSQEWPELRVLIQPSNQGKGAAVTRGMLAADGDYILFMDADLATPIEELASVIPHFRDESTGAVVGVRTYQSDTSKWRRVLGLAMQLLAHLIVFDCAVVDSQCGFKCFTFDAAQKIFRSVRIRGGMFDVELFVVMQRCNIKVVYQPVHWTNKAGSRINILRCVVFDVWDMIAIRMNDLAGRYRGVKAEPLISDYASSR